MKRFLASGALVAMIVLSGRAQSSSQGTGTQTPPPDLPPGLEKRDELPPGLQNRDQLPPGLQKRVGDSDTDAGSANTTGTQNQLPATGREATTSTQTNTTTQLRIQAVTTTDQPIATQVQQVLTTEPVLAQTLPTLNIQVNGGVVILNGDVQCGAESVLVQNLIYQRLPRTVRIQNHLRLPGGAMAPVFMPR